MAQCLWTPDRYTHPIPNLVCLDLIALSVIGHWE